MRSLLTLVLLARLSMEGHAQSLSLAAAARTEAAALATRAAEQPPPPRPSSERSWIARHPARAGAIIGLGIGVPLGVATCKYPGVEGRCSYYTYPDRARTLGGLTIGLLGAGVGAVTGAVVAAVTR